nr:MAG TPA: hypothetical protein [Caudoviricetes sp.]
MPFCFFRAGFYSPLRFARVLPLIRFSIASQYSLPLVILIYSVFSGYPNY